MKCKLPECSKEAQMPYEFCSGTHNYQFRNRINDLVEYAFDGNKFQEQLRWYNGSPLEGNKPVRMQYTVEEAILYLKDTK